jgi:hypothetical protein
MARGPRPRRRLQQRCTETRWRTDPVCLRSRRCRDLPQPADERPISSVRDSSVASCLPQPRWPPLKALALVAGCPLATLGTAAGRPRASRRSPPSRRCVRAAVRAWTDRAGAAADGDGAGAAPDTRGGGECRQPCVAARSDPRRGRRASAGRGGG